jgi:hypothetical protein
MIILSYGTHDGVQGLMLVLEPGNIEKLRMGKPIIKRMQDLDNEAPANFEICVAFTPNPDWVDDQISKGKAIEKALEQSLGRNDVFVRPESAEKVVRFEGRLK